MQNPFSTIALNRPKRNVFDLSHDVKMSFGLGKLVPSCVIDCIPGDKFQITPNTMLRFMPLVSPVMHRVNVTTDFFFVPNRILWDNWEDFITGKDDSIIPPYIEVGTGGFLVGSLADYFGFPLEGAAAIYRASAFPFAAYAKIFDEYYRDQNLVTEEFVELTDANNSDYSTLAQASPFFRAWMHDYFTSCLPFAQAGDAVTLPLTTADGQEVYLDTALAGTDQIVMERADFTTPIGAGILGTGNSPSGEILGGAVGATGAVIDPNGTLKVDVNADAVDINTLRRAFRLQEWLEKNARGGRRYVEHILAHFGKRVQDYRLQRPELIGRVFQAMSISEVLATATTVVSEETTPVGNMSGHGVSVGGGHTLYYNCPEHGWIIGIINVQPVTGYQQGVHRSLTRETALDYYWPTFAHIGEQEVKNKEVYVDGVAAGTGTNQLDGTFGYLPRYSEYRYLNSRTAGAMRDTLSFWHMNRIFDSQPALNADFVTADPTTRVFAVTEADEQHIIGWIHNQIKAVRPMPKYGMPSF